VARDLGLSQNMLSRWVLQYSADHQGALAVSSRKQSQIGSNIAVMRVLELSVLSARAPKSRNCST
jgi:hypothetical protein